MCITIGIVVRDHKGLVGWGLVAVSSRQATLSMDGCIIGT